MHFNKVDNKVCKSVLCGQLHLDMHMCQDSTCSWNTFIVAFSLLVSFFLSRRALFRSFLPFPVPPFLPSCFIGATGCLFSLFGVGAHGWVAKIFQAMVVVSIQEVVGNHGSSWMIQALNLHFVRQLLIYNKSFTIIFIMQESLQ